MNMYDTLCRILQAEGWAGLYNGIVPSIVKAAPAGTVTFVAYKLCQIGWSLPWLETDFVLFDIFFGEGTTEGKESLKGYLY